MINQTIPSADAIVKALKPTNAGCAALGTHGAECELCEFTKQLVGSRRQQLRELSNGTHCPAIGVCSAIDSLQCTAPKFLVGAAAWDHDQLLFEAIAHSM